MSNNNDAKILKLKEQINDKRLKLDKIKRFSPITNCSIELEGIRQNLNVLGKDQLTLLLIKLNIYRLSVLDLKITDYMISGYSVEDWITDVKGKLEVLTKTEEERKLKLMEERLTQLLSEEKKTELELDEIEKLL